MIGTVEVSLVNDQWERVVMRQSIGPTPPRAMFGRVELTLPDITVSPELEIRGPSGQLLADGSPLAGFGTASVGTGDLSQFITIFNHGNDYLTEIGIVVAGTHANDFRVTGPVPESLPPGMGISVEISFNPTTTGNRSAVLTVTSDDADESSVSIQLNGSGTTPAVMFQAWAAAHGLTGTQAATGAIPHHDGVPNLLKYAFNMNGAGPDRRLAIGGSAGLPVFRVEGGTNSRMFVVEYLRRKGSGLVYQPKVSSDLANFSPMTGSTSFAPVIDGWERVTVRMPVPAAAGRLFARVDVIMP
jgi:hypothetical protein